MNTLLIDDLLAKATCAVLINNQIAGTAWLVSDEGHLLTAGHVLFYQENGEYYDETYDKVEVKFVDNKTLTASQVVHNFSPQYGMDFAVLQLDEPVSHRQPLPISLVRSVPMRSKFRLYGYGKERKYQTAGVGEFLGPYDIQHSSAYRLFNLDSKQLGESGYSGGAVFSDDLGAVVAVQIEATKTNLGAGRDTVLAMPLYRVAGLWEPLRALAIPQKAEDDTIVSEPITEVDLPTFVSSTSASFIRQDTQTITSTGASTQFFLEETIIINRAPEPVPPTPPPTTLSEKVLSVLESCFELHRQSILATWEENECSSAETRVDDLKYAFFTEPPELDKVKSVLEFFKSDPATLVKVQKLLREWVLQGLVGQGGEQMAREYERLVFGGN